MSQINVSNLSFEYPGSFDQIFKNVSLTIDSDWKLGLVGRNGRGKTTFLKLLLGQFEYTGKITAGINFDYFPFEIKDSSKTTIDMVEKIYPNYEFWELCRDVSLLGMQENVLFRPLKTLSGGEQTKIMLAILFIKQNNFLLIDEPTNHLDAVARDLVARYLSRKRGFILVSHDRYFLDSCIDHVMSINRANIEVQQGNLSSWLKNKENQDNFELAKNEHLKKDINRLTESAKRSADWSDKVEATKHGVRMGGLRPDRGFIGHKAAKMMQRAKNSQKNKERAIEEKTGLLQNIDLAPDLKLAPLKFNQNKLLEICDLSLFFEDNMIFKNLNLILNSKDRIGLQGKNGCGKSSLIKLILGQCTAKTTGTCSIPGSLKISYVSQDTSYLSGNLKDFAKNYDLEESLFKAILRKLGLSRMQFEKNISEFSEGQKKKVLIAASLCTPAHLYIWDEPLNFVDIMSRIQIENLILRYEPTMIFVEHDRTFFNKIATKSVSF